MLFHTAPFAVFFLVFCCFYFSAKNQSTKVWIVLIFSNIFYAWWSWKFLGLLWLTIIVDYLIAKSLGNTESTSRRKLLIITSLSCNLGILALFKYFNFFISSIELVGVSSADQWYWHDLILPVGLSFYTFQSMSYTIDVYRRKYAPIKSLLKFSAFICYFPPLVAGPIERAPHLLPQILSPSPPTRERISAGVFLFCLGFFRKSVADTLALMIDPTFSDLNAASPSLVLFAVLGFGLQIYLDFSGYTDMARGISKILGIDLMVNFRSPYLSFSPREFWQRWHISLSQWLRDYLYISLGGNRRGELNHLRNLMITMLLGGLWHGAGANFLIWGGLHGAYLCVNHLLLKSRFSTVNVSALGRYIGVFFSWAVTWIAVNYAWIYFRCPTFEDAKIVNEKIFEWLQNPELPNILPGLAALITIIIAIDVVNRLLELYPLKRLDEMRLVAQDIAAGALFTVALIFTVGLPTQQFIYFRF